MVKQLRQVSPLILVWTTLLLYPAGHLAEIPMWIMAGAGLTMAFSQRHAVFKLEGIQLFSKIFLFLYIPIAFSIFDAVNINKTISVALTYPRWFFSGLFIAWAFSSASHPARIIFFKLCAMTILFWVGDSLIMASTGTNLFGYTYDGFRLTGIFGVTRLGIYLATFSPLLIVYAVRYWHASVTIFIILSIFVVLLLAVSRAGWISLAVIIVALLTYYFPSSPKKVLRFMLAGLLLGVLTVAVLYSFSSGVSATLDKSILVFKLDEARSVDHAISYRLPIWRTALALIEDNPIFGVGARGFRYAYLGYASEEDREALRGFSEQGAAHSHQMLLEILSETGSVGALGWLMAMGLLIRSWVRASTPSREAMLPSGLALLAIFFPLNTHFAFYSSSWSLAIFWFLAIYCGSLHVPQEEMFAASSGEHGCGHLDQRMRG